MTIEDALVKYPHILSRNSDGSIDLYADHHMLSQLRLCEAKFTEEILNGIGPKAGRYFSLEFGTWLHECLDEFYKHFKLHGNPPPLDDWSVKSILRYAEYDLDFFKPDPNKLVKDYRGDERKWYALGGIEGARRLLFEYYAWYLDLRYKVVATEVFFGRDEKIPLGSFYSPANFNGTLINCNLTGIMDLVIDNGYKIAVADHKTTARFDGYESNDFDPHEGITGYIYAINHYLKNKLKSISSLTGCNDGYIFHISIADNTPRFKPTYIHKTNKQLEEFAERQLRSCKRLIELILGETPDWNTLICNNIYNSSCPYRELHRQPTEQRENTIKQFYELRKLWNPRERDRVEVKKEEPSAVSGS